MGELTGKVAVVTGASRGIGAAVARRFAAGGATVALAARTTTDGESRLDGTITQVASEIVAAGGQAHAFRTDLSDPGGRAELVTAVTGRLGGVDILVNNAAVTWFVPVLEFPQRRYDLMFEVQVTAPFDLARRVVPSMQQRGGGAILNISSRAARHPDPGRPGRSGTVYGMCKAALERLSTGLAAELRPDGIRVNALSPSAVVPTPGTLFHHLVRADAPDAEPVEVMAEAAYQLCRPAGPGHEPVTGQVTYSRDVLAGSGTTAAGMAPPRP